MGGGAGVQAQAASSERRRAGPASCGAARSSQLFAANCVWVSRPQGSATAPAHREEGRTWGRLPGSQVGDCAPAVTGGRFTRLGASGTHHRALRCNWGAQRQRRPRQQAKTACHASSFAPFHDPRSSKPLQQSMSKSQVRSGSQAGKHGRGARYRCCSPLPPPLAAPPPLPLQPLPGAGGSSICTPFSAACRSSSARRSARNCSRCSRCSSSRCASSSVTLCVDGREGLYGGRGGARIERRWRYGCACTASRAAHASRLTLRATDQGDRSGDSTATSTEAGMRQGSTACGNVCRHAAAAF